MDPTLSIVIITRNTKDLLHDLLQSVEQDEPLKPLVKEVIVIDNASGDGTVKMVGDEFPGVILVRNDQNRGFAASANQGILTSRGTYILLLNSDTLLVKGEVTTMVKFMDENPGVAICGPQLVYGDMRPQRSFAYIPSLFLEIIPPSFLEVLMPAKYSARRLTKSAAPCTSELQPRTSDGGFSTSGHGPCVMSPLDVPSLIGAAIIMRKSIIGDLGGFDERFFFFLEETDLCVRARERGTRVVFFAAAKVIHLQGRTVQKDWVRGRLQYNISLYKFIRKHHGALYYRLFQGTRFIKCCVLLVALSVIPLSLLSARTRRTYRYHVALLLWHLRGCRDDAGLLVSPQEQR